MKDLLSSGEERTCLGYSADLMKAISSSRDSLPLAAAWPSWVAGTEMKKILMLVVLVSLDGWRGVWQIKIFGQFAVNKNNIMWGLHLILQGYRLSGAQFRFPQLIKMFAAKCFRCNLPEYEEDEPHPEWNPPAMFCSKELASTWLP